MKENGKTTQPVNTGAANIGNGGPALALNEAAGGIYTPDGKTPGGGKSGESSDRAKNKSARARKSGDRGGVRRIVAAFPSLAVADRLSDLYGVPRDARYGDHQ